MRCKLVVVKTTNKNKSEYQAKSKVLFKISVLVFTASFLINVATYLSIPRVIAISSAPQSIIFSKVMPAFNNASLRPTAILIS